MLWDSKDYGPFFIESTDKQDCAVRAKLQDALKHAADRVSFMLDDLGQILLES
jgi:hypothetical protein